MMVLAPRPGARSRAEQNRAAQTVLRITIRDKSWTLCPGNLSIAERGAVRKQTGGMAFESYWDGQTAIGLDSLIVLWWLARRASGETNLTLDTAENQFRDFGELGPGELDIEQIDDDDLVEDPES